MRIHADLDPQPYFLATNHHNGDWCVQLKKKNNSKEKLTCFLSTG